jgi:hypothetical protein
VVARRGLPLGIAPGAATLAQAVLTDARGATA